MTARHVSTTTYLSAPGILHQRTTIPANRKTHGNGGKRRSFGLGTIASMIDTNPVSGAVRSSQVVSLKGYRSEVLGSRREIRQCAGKKLMLGPKRADEKSETSGRVTTLWLLITTSQPPRCTSIDPESDSGHGAGPRILTVSSAFRNGAIHDELIEDSRDVERALPGRGQHDPVGLGQGQASCPSRPSRSCSKSSRSIRSTSSA